MNKHFEDARYYLKRAGETAKRGIQKELEGIETRLREMTGEEDEPEPESSRIDRIREDLEELEGRAEGEAREAIENARARLREYRESA